MVTDITGPQARHISRLPKVDGLRLIAKRLNFGFVEENDLRAGALVDYYYDTLQFCAERGMPWSDVAVSLRYANAFFPSLIKDRTPPAVRALHSLAVEYVGAGLLRLDSAKKLVSYFVSSVLSHHQLYHFVFNNDQEDDKTTLDLTVEMPVNDVQLKDAQPLSHWKYQRRLSTVQKDEVLRNEKVEGKEKDLFKITNDVEKKLDRRLQEVEYDNIDMEFKKAEDFIASLTSDKIGLVQKSIELEVEKMKIAAQNATALKAIPVPQDLQAAMQPTSKPEEEKRPKSGKSGKPSRPASSASKKKAR